jgi:hypothetical protein
VSQESDRTDPLARGADEAIWGIPRETALDYLKEKSISSRTFQFLKDIS